MTKGSFCCVASCSNSSKKAKDAGETIRFFSLPSDPKIRKEWILKCYRRDKFNPKFGKICSHHFTNDDYQDLLKAEMLNYHPRVLKKSAVPSINLRPADVKMTKTRMTGKYRRDKDRKSIINQILTENIEASTTSSVEPAVLSASPSKLNYVKVTNKKTRMREKHRRDKDRKSFTKNIITENVEACPTSSEKPAILSRNPMLLPSEGSRISTSEEHLLERRLSESDSNVRSLKSKIVVLEQINNPESNTSGR